MNSSKRPNQDALYQALNIYCDAIRPFIFRNLKTVQGLAPEDRFQNEADIDFGDFPHLFRKYWHDTFKQRFDRDRDVRSAIGIITEARNQVAHPGTEDISSGYTLSRLHEIADILGQIDGRQQKREVEAIRNKLLARTAPTVETKPKLPRRKAADLTLSNTITHILEHERHLSNANEATIQQYVVLPILRALGWDDVNLASMEIQPEYAVRGGSVDYALKVGQRLPLFIECKKWEEPLDRHEDQIVTYAVKAGMPIVGLTNGKIWRFYFSWIEGTSVRDRMFCEIDIEDREVAVSDLEKCLLKSNVASGKAESNAKIALKEKEKTDSPKSIESEATVKKSAADKFRESKDLEARKEIGRQVAELRINAAGSKSLSWRSIRTKLGLKNDEFHKGIRREDHFKESVVERIESFESGWEYGGKLEVLLGFKPVGELATRIEACKPKST